MGCEQSTPVAEGERYHENLKGIGQTERQISKLQRAAMNNESGQKSGNKTLPKLDEQGLLLPEEVAKRTFSSIANKEVTLGTISNVTHVQYAHWTQRGYYPDDPHKQNQDEFGTHLQFAGVDRDAMLAVYDGHGKNGHSCAQFARERLPKAVAKHVRKLRCQKYQKSRPNNAQGTKGGWDPSKWPMLDQKEYENCCRKAFLEVNQAMHDAPHVLDTLSGTTAVSVNFHGNFVSICNVGDSRVVLGHRVKVDGNNISVHYPGNSSVSLDGHTDEEEKNDIDDEIVRETNSAIGSPVIEPGSSFYIRERAAPGTQVVAIPLSKDQTPFRRDERERVKSFGAAVMSIDQMQGKEEVHDDWGDMVLGETLDLEGDSPRVWVEGKEFPGCAFTRSLGDSLSESIGVTAVPEILSTELTQNDEYLVIASDGIFEFLTNQTVIDYCDESESALVACEKIVKAAYQQWLTYENRTDDITIVVCFLQNFKTPKMGGVSGTTEDLVESFSTVYRQRSKHMLLAPESENRFQSRPAKSLDQEEEVLAYVSEEAQAVIVRSPPPPPPMTFDNTEVVQVKVDSVDNGTSKTASVTSAEDDDNTAMVDDKATAQLVADERDFIQL